MQLTFTAFLTLDGVMQGPGAAEEDPRSGFDLGGWLPPHFDETVGAYMAEVMALADAFLLGRYTYDRMFSYWPQVDDPDNVGATALNTLPKYVVTRGSSQLTWSGAQRLEGDLATAVAELKQRPGRELQMHGSLTLAQSLMAERLIDRYRLLLFPVVLNRGQRLFAGGVPPTGLRLVDHRASGSGVVMLTYEHAGEPSFGTVQ